MDVETFPLPEWGFLLKFFWAIHLLRYSCCFPSLSFFAILLSMKKHRAFAGCLKLFDFNDGLVWIAAPQRPCGIVFPFFTGNVIQSYAFKLIRPFFRYQPIAQVFAFDVIRWKVVPFTTFQEEYRMTFLYLFLYKLKKQWSQWLHSDKELIYLSTLSWRFPGCIRTKPVWFLSGSQTGFAI